MSQHAIRPATPEDNVAIATLHIAGWQGAYGGIISQAYLDSLNLEERAARWRDILEKNETTTLIALDDAGKGAGFVSFGKLMTAPPGTSSLRPLYSSEILAIYLLPEHYRKGLGTLLMREAVNGLKEQKHNSLCLWVLEKNDRARKFYESFGGQRVGKKMITIGPDSVKEICYGWRDLSSF